MVPGEKTFGLKRISKMVSLIDPTSLQAARTASVARESPKKLKTFVKYKTCENNVCVNCIFDDVQLDRLKMFLQAVAHSSKPPFSSNVSLTS